MDTDILGLIVSLFCFFKTRQSLKKTKTQSNYCFLTKTKSLSTQVISSILETKVRPSYWQLKLSPNWVIQDNYLKTSSKKKRITVLRWPNQSRPQPDWSSKILRGLCINECLQILMKWSNTVKKSGLKSLHIDVGEAIQQTVTKKRPNLAVSQSVLSQTYSPWQHLNVSALWLKHPVHFPVKDLQMSDQLLLFPVRFAHSSNN